MANILLEETLSGKLSVEDIISWLTTTDVENSKWDHIGKHGCNQCDFIIYFLNFLRDQTKSILHRSYNVRQTPTKTIQSYVPSTDESQKVIKSPYRRISLNNLANQIADYSIDKTCGISNEKQTQSKACSVMRKELSPITSVGRFEKKLSSVVVADTMNELKVLSSLHNADGSQASWIKNCQKTPDKFGIQRNTSDGSDISPKTNLTSTPIIEKNSSSKIGKIFNEFTQFDCRVIVNGPSTVKSFQHCSDVTSDSCKESANCIGNTDNLENCNENFDTSNFSKNKNKDSNSMNKPPTLGGYNNDWYRLNNLNISSTSKNSMNNESDMLNNVALSNSSSETTVSSLYTNTPTTPQNSKLSYSRSVEKCQNSKSSPQHIIHVTPKQSSQHVQRGLKSTPRQNASLGDFISIEPKSSQRNSARKINSRNLSSKSSDGEGSTTDRLSITEDSFPEIGKNCGRRKRRIKPTKLDVSDGKAPGESSTFGVISRPQIVNPKFLEAMPTEKSDTLPFETERDLLRLERQKQQKNFMSNQSIEQPVQTNVSLKSHDLAKKSTGLLLVPSLEHVENREALDKLVEIYSSLLDYNLILNPMTELSFVISLITLQNSYENDKIKLNSDRYCSEENKPPNASDENLINKQEKSKEFINIDSLNEELGCKILNHDIVTITKDEHFSKDVKDFDNLTRSSIDQKENNFTEEPKSIAEENNKIHNSDEEYFKTIHNCVYFSISTLNTQRVLLNLLDRATLKILSENNRIAKFLPDLHEYLNTCYKLKLNESSRLKQHINAFSTTEANVSFQIDTDNHENFPSLGGFQNFRKQRDLFYEALRIWEANHLASGWKFSISLAGRVRTLLTLHNDATNYCHFARLFKSQLLLSCIGNGPQDDPVDDESFSFLKSLKHLDPDKLTRLRERLVTPISSRGPVPPPSFPGVQEFYKDFILHASNPIFYAHLQDCLVHEIMELNDTQFTASEIEDRETMVEEETKKNFITCISSLRLLAKVLGFIVSLPYRCETSPVESVLSRQLELRSQVLPPLNLQFCLQNAIENGKLALTIPWVVKYLAMLDPVSLRLPYYRTVLEMLCYIYCESKANSGLNNPLSTQVAVLLKFSIGWLFALCNFPERLYFNCRVSQFHRKFKSISNFSAKNLRSTLAIELTQSTDLDQSSASGPSADSLEIINERSLYVCCPFLTELKTLLTADNSNLNNNAPIRHITPVSSGFDKPIGSSGMKQLQLQLEEAFFHGQPISTRKTVDFVSERVASSCVKHICNSVLPPVREKNSIKFQDVISKRELSDDIEVFKSQMSAEMHSIASSLSTELKAQCELDVLGMCESRITKSIDSLLAEDTVPSVKKMCSEIAIRMASERINNWIQSHITGGSLFVKDMEIEIDKAYRNKSVSSHFKKRIHNVNATSPTAVIIDIRSMIWELMDNKGESLTLEMVSKSLDNLCESLTERADLLPGPEKIIGSISVDFALFLVAHRADIFVPEIHEKFINIWKMECLHFLKSEAILSRILSPRNVMLLATPGNNGVWLPLGELISKMLKEEVLEIEALSDQCTALLRYDWPAEILKHLSICLTEGIKNFKSTDEESERMKMLLEWIAETCNDMEFIYD